MTAKDEAVEMWDAGIQDVKQIADEVGRSVGTVYKYLKDAGVTFGAPGQKALADVMPDETVDKIIDAYVSTDEPAIRICRRYKISFTALYSILDRREIPLRTAHKSPRYDPQLTHAVHLYVQGVALKNIYIETGVRAPRLYDELAKQDIPLRRDTEY